MEYFCEICGVKLEGRRRKLCPECAKNPSKGARLKVKKEKPKQCRSCKYWNDTTPCCDYYFITGKLKLCDAPPNCTKYEKGKKEKATKAFSLQYWGEGKGDTNDIT